MRGGSARLRRGEGEEGGDEGGGRVSSRDETAPARNRDACRLAASAVDARGAGANDDAGRDAHLARTNVSLRRGGSTSRSRGARGMAFAVFPMRGRPRTSRESARRQRGERRFAASRRRQFGRWVGSPALEASPVGRDGDALRRDEDARRDETRARRARASICERDTRARPVPATVTDRTLNRESTALQARRSVGHDESGARWAPPRSSGERVSVVILGDVVAGEESAPRAFRPRRCAPP